MGVVRIDDSLLKKLREILKKEENKYKYNSLSSLINSIVHERILDESKKGGKK